MRGASSACRDLRASANEVAYSRPTLRLGLEKSTDEVCASPTSVHVCPLSTAIRRLPGCARQTRPVSRARAPQRPSRQLSRMPRWCSSRAPWPSAAQPPGSAPPPRPRSRATDSPRAARSAARCTAATSSVPAEPTLGREQTMEHDRCYLRVGERLVHLVTRLGRLLAQHGVVNQPHCLDLELREERRGGRDREVRSARGKDRGPRRLCGARTGRRRRAGRRRLIPVSRGTLASLILHRRRCLGRGPVHDHVLRGRHSARRRRARRRVLGCGRRSRRPVRRHPTLRSASRRRRRTLILLGRARPGAALASSPPPAASTPAIANLIHPRSAIVRPPHTNLRHCRFIVYFVKPKPRRTSRAPRRLG